MHEVLAGLLPWNSAPLLASLQGREGTPGPRQIFAGFPGGFPAGRWQEVC